MSEPSTVIGGYFIPAVDVTVLGLTDSSDNALSGYVQFCGLSSKTYSHRTNTTDQTLPNCGDPEATPWVTRTENSREMTAALSGVHNRGQLAIVRAIYGKKLPYRLYEYEPGSDPKAMGYWGGTFQMNSWDEGATDEKGNVSASYNLQSDGAVAWTTISAPTLADLTLSSSTATHATPWTATISGASTPSTIDASASDGTVLKVDGNTISGTFAAAGSVNVTLTETNRTAAVPTKQTTIAITVS